VFPSNFDHNPNNYEILQCIATFRLYSSVKVICKEKWSIGDLLLKSSFSERMVEVASTWAISSAFIEATVNEVISKRFVKKQQMR